jgi:DNA repair protein RadC
MTTTITTTKSIRLKILKPIYSNLIIKEEELPEYLCRSKRISSSNDVFQMFRSLVNTPRECFIALHLDNKNKILCVDYVSQGSLTASIVHPREVFTSAILSAAASLVYVHQHPSGCPEASAEDLSICTRLKQAGELLGIRTHDFIIIGDDRHVSLADRGFL